MKYLMSGTLIVVTGLFVAVAAAEKHEGKVVEAGKGKLTMTDMDGKNKHSHEVADTAKITLDGKAAKLDELKNGFTVEVTTDGKAGATVIAAKSAKTQPREVVREADKEHVLMGRPYRASKIIGAAVKNSAGEDLGKIEDFVVEPASGRTKYAVLSFGGFLGIGDKWFAIPWRALNSERDASDKFHFVLHVSKERLKNAPGFDKNVWPDVGDPKWASDIETFYPAQEARKEKVD